jgi:hypothetical protein
MVGCTTGSRGEVPGERKPVIRDDDRITRISVAEEIRKFRMDIAL